MAAKRRVLVVDINTTIEELLRREDTDGDGLITVEGALCGLHVKTTKILIFFLNRRPRTEGALYPLYTKTVKLLTLFFNLSHSS